MSSSLGLYAVCLTVLVHSAYGMDCSFLGSDSLKDKVFSSCPDPINRITAPERSYCCPTTDGSFQCCDLPTFLLTGILIPVIVIGVILSLIISCICCFCCPFCCIYKRRNGRVF
ncbi:hypothetical protein GE061_001216 [Apolygus lucorum]|uniref:Uncharacterized protein n=1 Tax=Apolygus lucorum TaxID=248454 RepID=A0A6A4KDY9_APOLU|nr:hypothetical protein GE061_001216 [Apolygus lucorum]